ncbi:NADH-quinone oxidoreductase subunit C [Salirhabdus salicampi]|uniref:NADH-quinone oxidoreductase subunit C n=1 Tax=Salirhabdus salicampi TaxID=476102 RepID=UPI0020C4829C|nr:NADH-quinone oxidoreductase subunit C [Salirhabdus salicampi]MCP8617450.1 NADH-quinone oxidoreductase subunit C [Salirhabdus salicampi]
MTEEKDDKRNARNPRRKKAVDQEKQKEQTPSPNQPLLDHYVNVITQQVGANALVDSYVNTSSKDIPTIIAHIDYYYEIAKALKSHQDLQFDYVSDFHGIDYETHMELYVHLYSFTKRHSIALKVQLNREEPVAPSLVPLYEGANWPECEVYDLLGVQFQNHPELKRILLGEDWKGYPLRKDYEPYDVEV